MFFYKQAFKLIFSVCESLYIMLKRVLKKIIPKSFISFIFKMKVKVLFCLFLFLSRLKSCNCQWRVFGFFCNKNVFLYELPCSYRLDCESETVSETPNYKSINVFSEKIRLSSINLYELKDCFFSVDSSNFLVDDDLIVDKIPHIDISVSNYATGFLRMHNDTVSLIKLHDVHDLVIESAYFLGGNGSENYYHWMVELLPKLQYIATKSGFERCANIVVSSRVLEFDSFKKTLVFSVKGFKFNIYYLDKKNTYRIRKLLVITKPSDVLFNSKNVLSRVDFCFYRKSSIDYTVKLVEDIVESNELDLLGVDFFERVFIGRMPGLARSYNQDEIEELLVTKYGFTTVFLENYSIEEQFMIFKKAKCIAGPSGAAWTNLMFCNKNSVLISWLPDNISDFSVYSSLSSLLGLNMFFVEAEADCVQELHTSYYLSPVRLARLIDEVLM